MRRVEAYLGGMAVGGCVVERPPPYLTSWLKSLGIYRERVELDERYCRYRPIALLEHVYFLKGAFETYGEFFAGDPHGGDVIAIFKVADSRLVESLRLLGIDPLETTDEKGVGKYVVVYRPRDVRRFVKLVKPVVDDPATARLLGLCTQRP